MGRKLTVVGIYSQRKPGRAYRTVRVKDHRKRKYKR